MAFAQRQLFAIFNLSTLNANVLSNSCIQMSTYCIFKTPLTPVLLVHNSIAHDVLVGKINIRLLQRIRCSANFKIMRTQCHSREFLLPSLLSFSTLRIQICSNIVDKHRNTTDKYSAARNTGNVFSFILYRISLFRKLVFLVYLQILVRKQIL